MLSIYKKVVEFQDIHCHFEILKQMRMFGLKEFENQGLLKTSELW